MKKCDTCTYRNQDEYHKPCIVYRDDCEYYEKERGDMTNEEIIEELENVIELIKQDGKDWLDDRDIPILEACIKSLTALDEIRAEIQENINYNKKMNYQGIVAGLLLTLDIIDKYRGEK